MSVPTAPTVPAIAFMPFRPRLPESTVAWLRSTDTLAFDRAALPPVPPPLPLPSPRYTLRFFAKVPPVSKPMDCAWRSISERSDWNSLFSVDRLPVNVPEADCVASVFNRSRMEEMLLMPPSMIWSCAVASLPLATP